MESLFPKNHYFRPQDRYTDFDVMAIYFVLTTEWCDHNHHVPPVVIHMRGIVKTPRWSFELAE